MKRILLAALALTLCAALAAPADAAPVTLQKSDSAITWTGWTNNSVVDNNDDDIGTPDVDDINFFAKAIKVTFEFDKVTHGAYLKTVELNYDLHGGFEDLQMGDLFIDDGQDGDWDWVIRASDIDKNTAAVGTAVNVYDFRSSQIALGSRAGYGLTGSGDGKYDSGLDTGGGKWDYVLSGRATEDLDKNAGANDNGTSGSTTSGNNTGVDWSAYDSMREDHPWAVSSNKLGAGLDTDVGGTGDATVTGWTPATVDDKALTFDVGTIGANPLAGVKLALTQAGNIFTTAFRIGFAFNCANDVVFEDFTKSESLSVEVPEPSTVLLLATGLVGLVGYRRRRA